MSPSESSAPGSTGRRRKPDEADSIEGLAAPPPERTGAKGTRRRRKPSTESKGRSTRSRVLLGTAAVVAVVVIVVLGVQYFLGGSAGGPPDPRPVAYQIDNVEGNINETLTSREVDTRALSESEVLERGNEEIESQGITFELASTTFTDACEDAVWGEEVRQALADAECTQAAVGGYTSDDHVGVAAMFNLVDVDASAAVAEAMEPPDSPDAEASGFVSVPSGEASLDDLGTGGYSAAQASVSGHYLVIAWAQSKDPPGADERENLSAPLIALTNFRDPLFRRVVQLENALEQGGGEEGAAGAEPGGEGDPGATQPEGGAEPGTGVPEGGTEPGVPQAPAE
ncbi:hypothetical protein F4561_001849 [Lipingzhangella halophila]|uniref:Uncharacterized protein n=1 Tax=Lipingzhangella halophila TaxID=1783352 RepID=A0A7W7RFJ1_9ACTN|nr:hypothetical protein [Lipingzhangella halophila]MBB4931029.1 hypothetical protein [Lipingzhangella halophila]